MVSAHISAISLFGDFIFGDEVYIRQLADTPMSQNPFWAISHVVEIWLADRYGALRPDWLNSHMLKTLLAEFSVSKNLIGCVVHGKKASYVFLTFDPDANKQT